jgi:hypothetical protein
MRFTIFSKYGLGSIEEPKGLGKITIVQEGAKRPCGVDSCEWIENKIEFSSLPEAFNFCIKKAETIGHSLKFVPNKDLRIAGKMVKDKDYRVVLILSDGRKLYFPNRAHRITKRIPAEFRKYKIISDNTPELDSGERFTELFRCKHGRGYIRVVEYNAGQYFGKDYFIFVNRPEKL